MGDFVDRSRRDFRDCILDEGRGDPYLIELFEVFKVAKWKFWLFPMPEADSIPWFRVVC